MRKISGGAVLINYRIFVACCFVWLLTACSDSNPGEAFAPSAPADAAVGGLWDGTGTDDLEPGVVRVIGVVAEDGRAEYFKVDSNTGRPDFTDDGVQFAGTITSLENVISGNIRIYAPVGTTFANGLTVAAGTLAGTITERTDINGVWTAESGDTGTIDQLFSNLYDRDSALSVTQGDWTGTSSVGDVLALSITSSGTIFAGRDSNGCVYTSAADDGVNIIDPTFNVYEVNINITFCGQLNGSYSGLGFTSDGSLGEDIFTISVTNNDRAILIEVTR